MRSCDGCTLCCEIFAVPELYKERWEFCTEQIPGKGCDIYKERPGRCRTFSCLWQQEHPAFRELHPEEAGFVAGFNVSTGTFDIHPDPGAPDKWRFYRPQLERLGEMFPVVLVLRDEAKPIGKKAQSIKFIK